jgi:ribosomal protein S18 acetylase RimI-like enzyme
MASTKISSITAPIAVERATISDVAAIQSIAAEAWHAAYGDFMPKVEIDDFMTRWYNAESVRQAIEWADAIFLVMRAGSETIGFGMAGASSRGAMLYRLYLRPAYWGKRIGDLLLAEIEAWLIERDYDEYGLYVLESNQIGRRFYERHGFVSKPELNDKQELYLWKAL